MVWVPTASDAVASVAIPLLNASLPKLVAPSKKVTVPLSA
jgi:hypothetical protein